MSTIEESITAGAEAWWRLDKPFTDEAVSTLIAEQLADSLAYVPGAGWHAWEQSTEHTGVWREVGSNSRFARNQVAAVVTGWVNAIIADPSAWADLNAEKSARRYLSYGAISATISALESKLLVNLDCFDQAAHELNTPTGVLDLRTCTLTDGLPSGMRRKLSRLEWRPELVDRILHNLDDPDCDGIIDAYGEALDDLNITHTRFHRFLIETFGRDDALATYAWLLIGGCFYGDGPQDMFHIVLGSGANGKSVLWNTITWFLGGDGPSSYSAAAPVEAIIQNQMSGGRGVHSLWTAQGCRLLFFPELPYGKVDESTIKSLASGEAFLVNRKFVDERVWRNSGKLVAHTNIEPRVSQGRDGGLWRRMRLLPHLNVVPVDRQDVALRDGFGLLPEERELVGSFIAAAAQKYATTGKVAGLKMPATMLGATEDYRDSEDHLGRFISECVVTGMGASSVVKTTDVFKRYKVWCEEEGLRPSTASTVTRDMSNHPRMHGVERKRRADGHYWVGISLLRTYNDDTDSGPEQERF